MPDGPSRRLERFVGGFIPPACREEVLGDLNEKYVSPMQYIGLAVKVIPFVILSRIRRTSDLQIRLTEALLIYASFFAAAWFSEPDALMKRQALFHVAIPTAMNLFDLLFQDLWAGGSKWLRILVSSVALGIGIGFNVYGEFASVLLVRGLRKLTDSGRKLALTAPETATGTESVTARKTAGSLLIASGSVALSAIFLAIAGRRGGPSTMAAIVVFIVVVLYPARRKE